METWPSSVVSIADTSKSLTPMCRGCRGRKPLGWPASFWRIFPLRARKTPETAPKNFLACFYDPRERYTTPHHQKLVKYGRWGARKAMSWNLEPESQALLL